MVSKKYSLLHGFRKTVKIWKEYIHVLAQQLEKIKIKKKTKHKKEMKKKHKKKRKRSKEQNGKLHLKERKKITGP